MAQHTSLALMVLALSTMGADPGQGLAKVLADDGPAGLTLRRMLPAAIVVPVVLGWVHLQGQRAGLYGPGLGLAIVVGASVIVLSTLIWLNARQVLRIDVRRQAAEQQLNALNLELEHRINARTQELAESEHRFRTLAETAADVLIRIGPDRVIRYASPACVQLVGYEPHELVGMSIDELLVPDDEDRPDRQRRQTLEGGRLGVSRVQVRRKNRRPGVGRVGEPARSSTR